MRWGILLMLLTLNGCGYGPAQLRLVEQARKGVALIGQSAAAQQALIEQCDALQHQRLDEAFDADVREHGAALSPDWVIEHRKAYAAGLAALDRQIDASRSASAVQAGNLKAVDAALARLQALAEAQDKWLGNWETELGLKGAGHGGE